MNVFVLIVCEILELLVSRVSRNDKVYELDTLNRNRVSQKENTRTHLSCRGLSAFIHPPTREHRVLKVRQFEEKRQNKVLAKNHLLCMAPKRLLQRLLPGSEAGA